MNVGVIVDVDVKDGVLVIQMEAEEKAQPALTRSIRIHPMIAARFRSSRPGCFSIRELQDRTQL